MKLIPRIIGSDCQKCLLLKETLQNSGIPYIYYDGDDPDHEKEQDEWKITEYPVLQIIDSETNQIKYSFMPGLVSIKLLKIKMELLSKNN